MKKQEHRYNQIQYKLWFILATSSRKNKLSIIDDIIIWSLILLNIALLGLNSFPEWSQNPTFSLFYLNITVVSICVFSLEYVLRLWSCISQSQYSHPLWGRVRFVSSFLSIIDLIVIFSVIFLGPQANLILGTLQAEKPIRGVAADRSRLSAPEALLFRSNMGLFGELMRRSLKHGEKCHIAGGAQDMAALLGGILDLQAGRPSTHPDLAGFPTWIAFRQAASQEGAPRELQQLLKVATSYPQKALIYALRKGSRLPEEEAEIILSTAHKAKGREFPDVRLGSDFPAPSQVLNDPENPFEAEEARLAYVAVTRAQRSLRGHRELVDAYRTRLMAMIEAQRRATQARETTRKLAHKLAGLPADARRQAIRELSTAQKKALDHYLGSTSRKGSTAE